MQGGIDACKQTLGGGLFVAGGAIDLAGKKQALDGAGFKVALQVTRVEIVVFNRITRAQDVRVLQTGDGAHQGVLDVKWQAGADAVGVDLVGVEALGFEKNLVAVFVGKAVDLVFNARAIAWAHAFDLAGEHGAAVKAAADDVVGCFGGVGDPTRHLAWVHVGAAHEAEHRHRTGGHPACGGQIGADHAVAGLFLAAAEVNAAPIQSGRRASFQPALGQLELFEPRRQAHRWGVASTATGVVVHAHMDLAVQKCAGGQHHGARSEANTNLRHSAHYTVTFNH